MRPTTLPCILRRAATAVLLAAAPAFAQQAPGPLPSDSAVRALLEARAAAGQGAGVVVGLIDADGRRRIVARGTGANGAPLDAQSVFEIGSVTKTFTGTLLASMAQAGLVRLDQPVAELLPAGSVVPSRNGRRITLVDLATHSSGLPRLPDNLAPRDRANPYADYDGARLLAFLAHYQLPRDVGALYEYSNLGVGLLGYALAARAGSSYERLVTDRVLRPLGLRETAITLTPAMRARLAPGHDAGGAPVANWDLGALAAAGALRSTVDDMLRYVAAELAPESTPIAAALRATQQSRFQTSQPTLALGLAWHVVSRPDGDTLVWHNGQTGGYASFVAFSPRRKVGLVVLSNGSAPLDDLLPRLMGYADAAPAAVVVRREIAVAPEVLDRLVGDYPLAPSFVLSIRREGGHLTVQATNQPAFPLFAETPTHFFLKVVDAQLEFETDAMGRGTAVTLVQNGARQRAPRAP